MNDIFETFQELLRSPEPNYSLSIVDPLPYLR
jgi:hypothetical protein